MNDRTEDPSNAPPAQGKAARSPWRRHLWRLAQSEREQRAEDQDLADQLAAPRPALWQQRHRQRPLTTAVSGADEADDVIILRPATKERP